MAIRYVLIVAVVLFAAPAAASDVGTVAQAGKARVVIDISSGTVVITEGVRISTVAVASGEFRIRVTEAPQVFQPGPFAQPGQTVVVPRTRIQVKEGRRRGRMIVLPANASLRDLVDRLNQAGVGPRELGQILMTIKTAGALHAEIIVR